MLNLKEFMNIKFGSLKAIKLFTILAICFNLFSIILLFKLASDVKSPELKYFDFYFIFNLMFLFEFLYLTFRNYELKASLVYSFTSNYIAYSFYLLLNEFILYFCNNLSDTKHCMCDGEWYASYLRVYIVRSTWLEYLLYFLLLSSIIKFIFFKIIFYKNAKRFILDFLLINITFLIIYFSLSKSYFYLNASIHSYYKNEMYSSNYYKMLREHYDVKNTIEIYDPYNLQWNKNNYDVRKPLYTKPTNLLTKILDCFVE